MPSVVTVRVSGTEKETLRPEPPLPPEPPRPKVAEPATFTFPDVSAVETTDPP